MANTKELARIIAHRTGLPLDHVEAVAYAIQSDSITVELANLLLTLAAEIQPEAVTQYAALLDDSGNSASELIQAIFNSFLNRKHTPFSQLAYNSQINVYLGTPAVSLVTPVKGEPHVERLYLPADDRTTWRETTKRQFTVMGGKFLFDVAADVMLSETIVAQ